MRLMFLINSDNPDGVKNSFEKSCLINNSVASGSTKQVYKSCIVVIHVDPSNTTELSKDLHATYLIYFSNLVFFQ